MLDRHQIASASQTLHDHWRAGTKLDALETWLKPQDRTEGYAIQAAIEKYSSTHLFGSSRFNSFGGHNGFGNRGFGRGWGWHGNGWRGNRYGGYGWRGYGWNRGYWPGYYNYGWGGSFFGAGFGWGWGFGVGWPYWGSYWGPGWAFGWDPWWYNPYWYSPWPSYNYYQDYPDIGYNNPPSYAPDALSDYDSSTSYLITPTLDPQALHFNVNVDVGAN